MDRFLHQLPTRSPGEEPFRSWLRTLTRVELQSRELNTKRPLDRNPCGELKRKKVSVLRRERQRKKEQKLTWRKKRGS